MGPSADTQGLVQETADRFERDFVATPYVDRLIYQDGRRPEELVILRCFQGRDETKGLIADHEMLERPRVLLVGNAGSGKSFILKKAFRTAALRFGSTQGTPVPLWIDLGSDLEPDLRLETVLEAMAPPTWGNVARGFYEPGALLFIDALDEYATASGRFIRTLERFITRHKAVLRGVYVGCRRCVWSKDWFGGLGFEVYHSDYLGREEYKAIIGDQERLDRFYRECDVLGIEQLLTTPFDGFYLARRFADGRGLPASRHECLSERVDEALSSGVPPEATRPPLLRLRHIAEQIACIGTLCGRRKWSEQAVVDFLGASQSFRQVDQNEVRLVLRSSLFFREAEAYRFTHLLLEEFLTAQGLRDTPQRKLRQLVEAPAKPGRVRTPVRGTAAFLASLSQAFADWLVVNDPLVALMSEMPIELSPAEREQLLRSVIDQSIAAHRPPWWEIAPRGECLGKLVCRYQAGDPESFLRPYLESGREMELLWATACAEAWGGCSHLNPLLLSCALDGSLHTEARIAAMEAILSSADVAAQVQLANLTDDTDDRVRSYALRALRTAVGCTPAEYMRRLRGGSRDRELLCELQRDVREYASQLDSNDLRDAFAESEAIREADDLGDDILEAMLRRALEIGLGDLPTDVLIEHLKQPEESNLVDLICSSLAALPRLFRAVWEACIPLARQDPGGGWELARQLGRSATDALFDLLPPDPATLQPGERRFCETAIAAHFSKDVSPERLAMFREKAPGFCQGLSLPRPRAVDGVDRLQEHMQRVTAVQEHDGDPSAQTGAILQLAVKLAGRGPRDLTSDAVEAYLALLPPWLVTRALQAFRTCVAAITYRRQTAEGLITHTPTVWELPFLVLFRRGERFEPAKLAEFLLCYGPNDLWVGDRPVDRDILDKLRAADHAIWERCVMELLEEDSSFVSHVARQLVDVGDQVFLGRCGERLRRGEFTARTLDTFLDYYTAFSPSDFDETLRTCYWTLNPLRAPKPSNGQGGSVIPRVGAPDRRLAFAPLLRLMKSGNDWAWEEFAQRLKTEDVPTTDAELGIIGRGIDLPVGSQWLRIIADWYALVKRSDTMRAFGLEVSLRRALLAGDGHEAIEQFRRLLAEAAYPRVEWDAAYQIMKLEEAILEAGSSQPEPTELVDFINCERLGMVNDDHDLLTWVGLALEELRGEFLAGQAVAGFRHDSEPNSEAQCQNVLWPLLTRTIDAYGLPTVTIEEFSTGPDRCDFCVVMVKPGPVRFRVLIELKVARRGYGRRDLVDPIENQLWERYLRRLGCRKAIYLVLWFRCDGYPGPAAWSSATQLEADLAAECNRVNDAHQVTIAPCVLDVSVRFREH